MSFLSIRFFFFLFFSPPPLLRLIPLPIPLPLPLLPSQLLATLKRSHCPSVLTSLVRNVSSFCPILLTLLTTLITSISSTFR
jgi:hypothetical protein